MAIDLSKLPESMDKFLMQILPLLYRQKMGRGMIDYQSQTYLRDYLKRLEARGEQETELGQDRLKKALAQMFMQNIFKGTEELPFPTTEATIRAAPAAEAYGFELPAVPTEYPQKLEAYSQTAKELMMAKVTGVEPSDETMLRAVKEFGLEAAREEIQSFSDAGAKRLDQILRSREIGVKEALVPVSKYEAITKRGELEVEVGKFTDEERKDWLKMVKDIEDHLKQEGVKKGALSEAWSLFGTGKVTDPLSAENRGSAYTILSEIRTKLIQKEKLTPGDIRFLQTIRNSWAIEHPEEEGGGLISPPDLADQAQREKMLETLITLYMEEGGLTREAAEERARMLMQTIK